MSMLKQNLTKRAKSVSGGLPILEKDFAISYILAGLMKVPDLENTLVMKGGTALKKLYFGEYRFSEDLDFTDIDSTKQNGLDESIEEACQKSLELLGQYGKFDIRSEEVKYKHPHPGGQEEFKVRIRFPWHHDYDQSVKIEITHDEPVLKPPESRMLLYDYDDILQNIKVKSYSLEEIIAEKLRAVLQQQEARKTKGWARPRGRDIYDIWSILMKYQTTLDINGFPKLLKEKCNVCGVKYTQLDDFFPKDHIDEIRESWTTDVGRFVDDLPDFQKVLDETKNALRTLLPT